MTEDGPGGRPRRDRGLGPSLRRLGGAFGRGASPSEAANPSLSALRLDALSPFAVRVLEILELGGRPSYVVGGAVRDLLLGRPLHDVDVATALVPAAVERLLAAQHIPTVGVGIRFGTVEAFSPETGEGVEVTTLRREGRYEDARHPDEVAWTEDLTEDLCRRDFTVNALAWRPLPRIGIQTAERDGLVTPGAGRLYDPFDGLRDLERRTLRAVGVALDRLREDPLRVARLFRFAAELGFRPEPGTASAARIAAPELDRVSRERIRDELARLILAESLWSVGEDVAHVLLPAAMPLWRELETFEESHWQGALLGLSRKTIVHKPVDLHSVLAASRVPPRPRLRWAALLHDLGKPRTFTLSPDGRVQFHGHEATSAEMARLTLANLRFPPAFIRAVCSLIEVHLFPWEEASETGYRRLIRRLGEDGARDLLELHRADVEASTPLGWTQYEVARDALEAILAVRPPVTERALAIDGRDVMVELDIGPSPEVGEVLRGLLEWVLTRPAMNDRATLLELVRSGAWRKPPPENPDQCVPAGPPLT